MTRLKLHAEQHMVSRIGWLRAAVLGANDGIISTASLIVGVAAASASSESVFLTGVAGLVAGSMSMAAGEYVSVCSQSDSETADIARETKELADDPQGELNELTGIYLSRGLDPELANQVARQLMARDPLAAHMRDELHLTEATKAKPVQAALTSALTFAIGAAMPLMVLLLTPLTQTVVSITVATLALLALLGAIGAHAGGAPIGKALSDARAWGLYISTSRGTTSIGIEEPALFSEPGVFLVRPDGTLYYGAVQTMPFARPHFDELLAAIDFAIDKNYPARGEYTGEV